MNRAEIRTLAETRSDTDDSGFPELDQKNAIIDDEARRLLSEMVNNNLPVSRLVSTVTATGAGSYPIGVPRLLRIPAVRDARYTVGGNRAIVRRANNLDRNTSVLYGQWPFPVSEIKYDVELDVSVGWVIKFYPPSVTGNFEVEVIQGFAGFTNDASEWYGPDPSGTCIALASAIRFKQKEDEKSGQALAAELAQAKSELWQVVSSLAPPMQVEDWVSLEEGWFNQTSQGGF